MKATFSGLKDEGYRIDAYCGGKKVAFALVRRMAGTEYFHVYLQRPDGAMFLKEYHLQFHGDPRREAERHLRKLVRIGPIMRRIAGR